MSGRSAKNRITELVELLTKHNEAYYQKDAPLITDAEYDALLRELEELEAKHPELKRQDSPTLRVGAKPLSAFTKRKHGAPMLSLANSLSRDELVAFDERVKKNLGLGSDFGAIEYLCEVKFDGLSINLTYIDGFLHSAVTRGDGAEGEDVTENIRTIKNVPLRLSGEAIPKKIEIRGEVIMPITSFRELNKLREEEGDAVFANPRNAAAGSVRQLDSTITASRSLKMFAYAIGETSSKLQQKRQSDVLESIFKMGFEDCGYHKVCSGVEEVQSFYEHVQSIRDSLEFDIDGVVVKVNRLDWQDQLGFISRSPRSMTAYKFAPRQERTRLLDIKIQVGRTGVLTPVAVLEPVVVHGVRVSRAALHNEDEIARKDIQIGDLVVVQRAGDVIPEIVEVVKSERNGKEIKFRFPNKCPACNAKVLRSDGEVAIRCVNVNCVAQNKERLKYFVSKSGMDIVGLGVKIVEQMVDEGLVRRVSDFYRLTRESLLGLEGFQDRSVDKLLQAIEKSKGQRLAKVINALGIRHVGERIAGVLAREYSSLPNLTKAKKENLVSISEIGEVVAESIEDFFSRPENVKEVQDLIAIGINPQESGPKGSKLNGKVFVLTGTLPTLSRQEATALIESQGGKVSSSVSKKTNYLVAGEDAGSKLDKALELGVTVISEPDLLNLTK